MSNEIIIPSDTIHLWFCTLDEAIDPLVQDQCEKVLSPDETTRMKRFRFEKHQLQFLISHAFLRIVLSRYQNCSPTSIAYSLNEYGKPSLLLNSGQSGVSFNLSHTYGLACCAVTREGDVGVDVEFMERMGNQDEISEKFFSPVEFADMMKIHDEKARKKRFFHLWTLKEAYIKAKGMGLSLPLDLFSFHFHKNDKISVTFDPKLQDSPEHWKFCLLQPTELHRTAIAYKSTSPNQNITLETFQTFPFCTGKGVSNTPLIGLDGGDSFISHNSKKTSFPNASIGNLLRCKEDPR